MLVLPRYVEHNTFSYYMALSRVEYSRHVCLTVRDLIIAVMSTKVGCNIGGLFTNIFAYADDIVLLAPSWRALQYLINKLADCAFNIDMLCNVEKSVYGISTYG